MSKYNILKAVEHDKTSAKFRKQYPTLASLQAAGWWLQKKYDGCFGMAVMRFNGPNVMLSRTGEDYTHSCLGILTELHDAACEQSGSWDDFVVLGEVWSPDLSFPTISGQYRRRQVSDALVFVANDLLPPELVTSAPYEERFENLQALLPDLPGAECKTRVAATWRPDTAADAMEAAIRWQADGGFDGAILRDPRAAYSIGDAKDGQIIKVKPVMSLDLRVVELTQTRGAKTGRAVFTCAVMYRGVATEVGSGMPHKFEDLPALGQIVEVECMGLTADGKLREPRFKGVRHDKTGPDT